ncbi:MAG: FHA domain-containing protein [Desulfobacterales bacterium]|nr:FHA domain-containing protein [Desulfobacterales bacterium]
MPRLSVLLGYGKAQIHKIEKDDIKIGRSPDNDIILSDHTISRKHAALIKTSDGYLLKDFGSNNGTIVNGSRIAERFLRHQDRVKIGPATLVFLDEAAETRALDATLRTVIEETPDQKEEEVLRGGPVSDGDSDQDFLASIKEGAFGGAQALQAAPEIGEMESWRINLLDLEKSNKILYALYQISRKLNSVQDFDDLLATIMDSIFHVIDADYGFVALMVNGTDELIPKVVKYREPHQRRSPELRVSRTILNKVTHEKVSVLTSNAMEDSRFQGAKSILLQNIRSVMCVPLWRKDEVIGIIQLDSFRLTKKFTRADLELLTTISNQMAMVIEQANLNEKIRYEMMARNRLERFHSPEVVELIIRGRDVDEDSLMTPTEKFVTVLFTDIVSFTPLSERLSPGEVSLLLNQYFGKMTDIIFDYHGTLDKYMGDAIMAVFGAPIERMDDAVRAVKAALDMRSAVSGMMEEIKSDRRFGIRLGINTGRVVAGNLGSPRRMDYTVIGDTVNTASRLESIAEPGQILLGEKTYASVKGQFKIREIGKRSVKGKSKAITVYEVLE